jgi:hypothetical protein
MHYVIHVNLQNGIAINGGGGLRSGQLGGWLDDLISAGVQTGVQTGVGLLQSRLGGNGQFRGLAAINQGGSQVISQMQQLLQAVQQNPAAAGQAVQLAAQLRAALDDPNTFYQAQHGSDAEALRNFKSQADSLLQQIQAAAAATAGTPTGGQPTVIQTPSGPVVPTTGPNGQTIYVPATDGISMQTLLLVGGGILALVFLMR